MKLEQKAVGLCFHFQGCDDFARIREAGFDWLRMHVAFPWKDRMFGTLSDEYRLCRDRIEAASGNGFRVMATTPGLGSYRFDPEIGKTRWFDEWPAFAGVKGTASYEENVRATCAFLARDLAGLVGPLWCHRCEIDIATLHGGCGVEVAAQTAFYSAAGVVSVDPDALCGINLSHCREGGLAVADMACRPGHSFGYIGNDQYFGSWQANAVDRWTAVIDRLHERYGLPVLACEWGYAPDGPLRDRPVDETGIPAGPNSVCQVSAWHHEIGGGHNEAVQAACIRRGLALFARHPHVLGSFLFPWQDAKHCCHSGRERRPAECFRNAVRHDRSPNPAYDAVRQAVAAYYPQTVDLHGKAVSVTGTSDGKVAVDVVSSVRETDGGTGSSDGKRETAVKGGECPSTDATVFSRMMHLSAGATETRRTAFAKGADVSWLPQMEADGFVFRDAAGKPQDCLTILKDHGMDAIRLRCWVNPSDASPSGHCGTEETVTMARRCAAMGFRIMIDLHYSDSWADPGQQNKPAAWSGHSFEELLADVYDYTTGVLHALKAGGITPEWVQVGNEITFGLLWPTGHIDRYDQMARLVRSGCQAVRAASPESRIVLHLDQGNDRARYERFFGPLGAYRVPYDVIGVSWYPYWLKADFTESIEGLAANLKELARLYDKDVLIAEVGGESARADDTHALLKAALSAIRGVPDNRGTGVFYWEPQAAACWSHYALGCWRDDGRPSPALRAFLS